MCVLNVIGQSVWHRNTKEVGVREEIIVLLSASPSHVDFPWIGPLVVSNSVQQ